MVRLRSGQKPGGDTGHGGGHDGRRWLAYAGELLPGFYDEWAVLEREHMQATYEQGAARVLELLQAAGRWSDVLVWAEKWIAFGQRPEARRTAR